MLIVWGTKLWRGTRAWCVTAWAYLTSIQDPLGYGMSNKKMTPLPSAYCLLSVTPLALAAAWTPRACDVTLTDTRRVPFRPLIKVINARPSARYLLTCQVLQLPLAATEGLCHIFRLVMPRIFHYKIPYNDVALCNWTVIKIIRCRVNTARSSSFDFTLPCIRKAYRLPQGCSRWRTRIVRWKLISLSLPACHSDCTLIDSRPETRHPDPGYPLFSSRRINTNGVFPVSLQFTVLKVKPDPVPQPWVAYIF